jgi:ABC-type multidrug transport system fused ATPase/permease subunit
MYGNTGFHLKSSDVLHVKVYVAHTHIELYIYIYIYMSTRFAKEDFETHAHAKQLSRILELARKRSIASASFFGAVDFSVKMSMLAVLGIGGTMVADGNLTVGELSSFLMYTLYVGFSFAGMSSFYSGIAIMILHIYIYIYIYIDRYR